MRHSSVYERARGGYAPPRQLTVQQVAKRLSCSETTVRRNITSGDLPAVRIGRASWRISEDDLAAFMEARSNQADIAFVEQRTE